MFLILKPRIVVVIICCVWYFWKYFIIQFSKKKKVKCIYCSQDQVGTQICLTGGEEVKVFLHGTSVSVSFPPFKSSSMALDNEHCLFFLWRAWLWLWRDGPVIKSTRCFGRGPPLGSQYPHSHSKLSITLVPRNLLLLLASVDNKRMHGSHTCQQNTYTPKVKANLESILLWYIKMAFEWEALS